MIDQTKLDSLLARALGDLAAGYGGVMMSLGNKLGLYKAMAGAGPMSSQELATRAGCATSFIARPRASDHVRTNSSSAGPLQVSMPPSA